MCSSFTHHQPFPALTEANRPTSLHAKAVTRAAARVKPARLDNFKRLEFHDLRHTFASLMNRGGRESPSACGGARAYGPEWAT
jgi:integrase